MESWIESFVSYTDNLESAPIFRRWAAISAIAAVLERKVFVTTSSPLYPNLYVFLVGDPGVGKTRPIMVAQNLVREIPDTHLASTSVTMASLVDELVEAKRHLILHPDPPIEYNTIYICADELSAFMDQYDTGLIAGLTTFFDCVPYAQARRTKDLRIKIANPQLNILSGTTPSNLIKFVPEFAWGQGFTSRVIMIYSNEKPVIDVFNTKPKPKPEDMIHDLKIINSIIGQFGWTEEYAKTMHSWKELGLLPVPKHPKLEHYCSRRFSHMIKLSMIACIDRGNDLTINKADFDRAYNWLMQAESQMPYIFESGGSGDNDSAAIKELHHYALSFGDKGVPASVLYRKAKEFVPVHAVVRTVEVMQMSGMLRVIGFDNLNLPIFVAA